MPRKPKNRSPKFGSASAFIRAQQRTTPAKDVVAAAAKAGFKIVEQRVYNVRSADAAKRKTKPKAPPRTARSSSAVLRSDLTAADAALIHAAAEVGLVRARELLARLERALGSAA